MEHLQLHVTFPPRPSVARNARARFILRGLPLVRYALALKVHTTLSLRRTRQRLPLRCNAADESNSYGSFIRSELVQQELDRIMQDWLELSKLMPRFVDFDTEGKRIFIDTLEKFLNRVEIMNARLKLTDDQMAKDAVNMLNRQALTAELSLDSLFTQVTEDLRHMRQVLEQEERITDPGELQAFRASMKAMALDDAGANERVKRMTENMSKYPMAVFSMTQSVNAMQGMKEALRDGEPGVAKYETSDPELYQALCQLFEF